MPKPLKTCQASSSSGPAIEVPLEITVENNSCDNPLFVENCTPPVVDASFAPLGCLPGYTGKVFLCVQKNPETGAVDNIEMVSVGMDGTITQPYSGEWISCDSPDFLEIPLCDPES